MAIVHCHKCNKELSFIPGRRKNRDFSWIICACGIRFSPKERGRVPRAYKPNTQVKAVDTDADYNRKLRLRSMARDTQQSRTP